LNGKKYIYFKRYFNLLIKQFIISEVVRSTVSCHIWKLLRFTLSWKFIISEGLNYWTLHVLSMCNS